MPLSGLETSDFSPRETSKSRSLSEDEEPGATVTDSDYDPNSPEPRYLQIAKAQLLRRKDLKCRDCGFMGLPPPDGMCPECGGIMKAPEEQLDNPQMTTDQIRAAIRQQWNDKQTKVSEGRQWFDVTGDMPDDKPKPPLARKRPNEFLSASKVPSCWGCGHDYLSRWRPDDLARDWKHQDTGKRMKNPICPDCYGEAGVMESIDEYAHRTVPTEFETGHMADLISHYGGRADGDRYVVKGDKFSHIIVSGHKWIHHHHGVRHEGHGVASLHAHLNRVLGDA